MSEVIFWDEDTQVDFMFSGRPLYVPGAERILPRLGELTEHARASGIRVLGSEDEHTLADAEISADPDWKVTYPPHCMAGTEGQRHVPETRPRDPLYVGSAPLDRARLDEIRRRPGEVYFRKQHVDAFTNPNVEPVLDALVPATVVVFGVATDVCVFHMVEGLLRRGRESVIVVSDAVRALDSRRGAGLLRSWRERGVRVATTAEVLAGLAPAAAGAA